MITETEIKKAISAYLDSLGACCWHTAFHNIGYTRTGIPDRLACYRGVFIALEVKRPPEPSKADPKPTKWQERELKAIGDAGGVVAVVWSVDMVREIIQKVEQKLAAMAHYPECYR